MLLLDNIYFRQFKGLSRGVWILAWATLINRAGAMVLPFLSIYLRERLDLQLSEIGWVLTAFGAGSMAGAWLGGKLTDRIGFLSVMTSSLILTGCLFILLQYVREFGEFCAAVFVISMIADTFRPAGLVAINAYSKPVNRTRSVTLIRLAINLGFSAGPALGGWIIYSMGYSGLFWIDGITCLVAGALLIALLSPGKQSLETVDDRPEEVSEKKLSRRAYALFIFICFLIGAAFMQLFSTLPLYYREVYVLNEKFIGWLLALNGILIFLFEMPLINVIERRRIPKLRSVAISCVIMGLSFFILPLSHCIAILFGSMILITLGEMMAFPFSNAYAMDQAPPSKSGQYMAWYTMSFSAAHIVGPNLGMQVIERFGYSYCWILFGLTAVVATILTIILYRNTLQ